MKPRISVIVPTRNRLATLQRALASVAAQWFRGFEVIVVDDGSTDGTAVWLAAQGSGIRVVRAAGNPGGAAAARNLGVHTARGDLIAFLDDDDFWQPGYLTAQVGSLDAHPDAAFSYVDHLEIDRAGRASRPDTRAVLHYRDPQTRLLAEGSIHTMSIVMVRRQTFDRIGPLDESLTIVHDLDWYRRVLAAGMTVAHVGRALVGRSVPGGLLRNHRRWFAEERVVLARAFAGAGPSDRDTAMIKTARSLFFAKVGFTKGDFTFGLHRLVEAGVISPYWAAAIAARRSIRRIGLPRAAPCWDAAGAAHS